MAVMAREVWTDERLDDLNTKVDGGFNDMRQEFRAMRGEASSNMDAMRGEASSNMDAMGGEMAANHRALMQMAAGIWITAIVGFLGVIGAMVAVVITQS